MKLKKKLTQNIQVVPDSLLKSNQSTAIANFLQRRPDVSLIESQMINHLMFPKLQRTPPLQHRATITQLQPAQQQHSLLSSIGYVQQQQQQQNYQFSRCPLCSRNYRSQAFLNEHMRKEHSVLI
uniref:C2H2-type domain-containing protein n=1 Tax=Megaselia scalaris TaxID=36166 RepID=T1GDQ5_MEGSC